MRDNPYRSWSDRVFSISNENKVNANEGILLSTANAKRLIDRYKDLKDTFIGFTQHSTIKGLLL